MSEQTPKPAPIGFDAGPPYRHWRIEFDPPIATVVLAVTPNAGLRDDYELKLNSYDLGVDIELHDIVQRLRFEHPEIRTVVLTGGLDKVFCAGANIQMLAGASHHHKVNFCKFTNETRLAIEDASANSGQVWIAAINGTAAGGGYELALACDEIVLVDDRSSSVSLPEVPMLGVLPGTGGLTRLTDKRLVRRDRADVFSTRTEGLKGAQAVEWGLVDSMAPPTSFAEHVRTVAMRRAATSDRPLDPHGVTLPPIDHRYVDVSLDNELGTATITIAGPEDSTDDWPLGACRELDHAILHLRFNEPELGTWVLKTRGDPQAVIAADDAINADDWMAREVRLYWKRTLKRLDVSSRTLVALVDPGSCFAGTLAELVLAADRSFMLEGTVEDSDLPPPVLLLDDANDGWYPMGNGLSRLHTRFWGHDDALAAARAHIGKELLAADAKDLGLVTATPDDIDWDDDLRLVLEERAAFSPDALSALEANLRFVGPETMETKIFGRLSAWQNWVFQRPNATGPEGALRRYGTGSRPTYDRKRV